MNNEISNSLNVNGNLDLSDLENVMKHRRRIQKILGEIDEQL